MTLATFKGTILQENYDALPNSTFGLSTDGDPIVVVKFGGNAIMNAKVLDQLIDDTCSLINQGVRVVLVHGGGTAVNDALLAVGKETKKVGGLRVTDDQTLEIAVDVFSAINEKLTDKFLEAQVENAESKEDARLLARSIVSSSLVKTAFFGEDANWGRIICAMGYSGAKFDPACVSISLESAGGLLELLKQGEPVCVNEILAKQILAEKNIIIHVDMNSGKEDATAWGCDLSYDYVRINGSYRT